MSAIVSDMAADLAAVQIIDLVHRTRVPLHNGRGNTALRKLGAVEEGILRRSARRGGEWVDQVLWSLLKEDWGDHWISTSPRVH